MSKTTTTVEQLQAAMLRRRAEAAEEYRELLLRNENPKPDDPDRLAECLKVLGRTANDIAEDLEILLGIKAGEEALASNAALDEPIKEFAQRRRAAVDAMQAEYETLRNKNETLRLELENEFNRLDCQRNSFREPIRLHSLYVKRWQAIIDGHNEA